MDTSTVFSLTGSIEYAEGSVVSRQILKRATGTVTLFAFDKGESLSEHTAPFDALVMVLDGEGEFLIAGTPFTVGQGQAIILPAGKPHAVNAHRRFKMVLTMIRE